LHLLHRDLHYAYEAALYELDSAYRITLREGGFLPEVETLWRESRGGVHECFTEIHEVLRFYLDKKPEGKIQ
jgi:hypothetical protein